VIKAFASPKLIAIISHLLLPKVGIVECAGGIQKSPIIPFRDVLEDIYHILAIKVIAFAIIAKVRDSRFRKIKNILADATI
jgi:hypothetical protein